MTQSTAQKKRSRRRGGPTIVLFPFLAVLVCAMGAMILVLMIMARQSRMQATLEAKAQVVKQREEMVDAKDAVVWRIEQLTTSRQTTETQLAEARLRLGHLEDHTRELRAKLTQLKKAWDDLDRLDAKSQGPRSQREAELARLHAAITEVKKKLAEAADPDKREKRGYAMIPYDGPNQTRRRPIYIECRGDAVVLQPEGVIFRVDDFMGPMGPGNPLASALRATREYWVETHQIDLDKEGEPYPLLLIRPDGIAAYYAAREAMKSWGSDFGYELIGEDWKLSYYAPDPNLTETIGKTVGVARARQRELIAAAPRSYAPRGRYRVAPTGGLIREPGSPDDMVVARRARAPQGGGGLPGVPGDDLGGEGSGDGGGYAVATAGSAYGRQIGDPSGGLGFATAPGGSAGAGAYSGAGRPGGGSGLPGSGAGATGGYFANAENTGAPGGLSASADNAPGTGGQAGTGQRLAGGSRAGATGRLSANAENTDATGGLYASAENAGATGSLPASAENTGGTGASGGSGNSSGSSANASGTASNAAGRKAGDSNAVGQPGPSEGSAAGAAAGAMTAVKRPEGYVAGRPLREMSEPPPTTAEASAGEPGNPLRPGEWQPTPPRPHREAPEEAKEDPKRPKKKLAEARGTDWGIRDQARGSTPITRPIRVECYPDRLVIVPDRGGSPRTIPLGDRTERSIDALVSAIWETMDSWGIAGLRMYWRPVLNVYVMQGAESRLADLQTYLEGSGLEIRRK